MNNYKVVHLASQYLAAAGLSFVENKADDSHASLFWNREFSLLLTHDLNSENYKLGLSYRNFALQLLDKQFTVLDEMKLSKKTHFDNLNWLSERFKGLDYKYELHYEIGQPPITSSYMFPDVTDLDDLIAYRNLAQDSLEEFGSNKKNISPIRVWPHHFDSHMNLDISENHSIGLGLAIPDNKVNEFYFYAYGFNNNKAIDVTGFDSLSAGSWMKGKWDGAVLKMSDATKEKIIQFYHECYNMLKLN